ERVQRRNGHGVGIARAARPRLAKLRRVAVEDVERGLLLVAAQDERLDALAQAQERPIELEEVDVLARVQAAACELLAEERNGVARLADEKERRPPRDPAAQLSVETGDARRGDGHEPVL